MAMASPPTFDIQHQPDKYLVYIITDSRGKFFDLYLAHHNVHKDVRFVLEVYRGWTVSKLWAQARQVIKTKSPTLVYIMGGINDITSRDHSINLRQYWPSPSLSQAMLRLTRLLGRVVESHLRLNTTTKLCILPEIGGNLVRYNKLPKPFPSWAKSLQLNLKSRLLRLNEYIQTFNSLLDMATPWFLDTIYKKARGILRPNYSRLYDGIHPLKSTSERMVVCLIKHTHRVLSLPPPIKQAMLRSSLPGAIVGRRG